MQEYRNKILEGDCLEVLKTLPDNLVDCCVTSPPYFGLRDYGNDKQIGLESTPEKYIQKLVDVFHEVKRVLKEDGTLWVNIGDSYSAKELVGIPWLLAFALRKDGWYLRQDIIWHKPNPVPESVKDRCTKSHEYIFLLSKKQNYFFDYKAIQEDAITVNNSQTTEGYDNSKFGNSNQESKMRQGMNKQRGTKIIMVRKNLPTQKEFVAFMRSRTTVDFLTNNTPIKRTTIEHWFRNDETGFSFPSIDDWNTIKDLIDDWSDEFKEIDEKLNDISYESDAIDKNFDGKRNKRDVWSITTKTVKEAHFATYPEELIEPCIKAGSKVGGIVLDPFFGSGTTGRVAEKLNRDYLGIELNPEYIKIGTKRTDNIQMTLYGLI